MKIKDKVLIVEDEQSISNFISMILTANGFDTIIVRSGEEALTMIASHCPDMIVLDLGLPDRDGMEVLKSVRKWANLPVVGVAARNHEHDKVEALDYGADDYLVKPFEMKELMETEVMPRLAAHFRQSKVVHRTAITYGLAESVLAATIAEWEAALPGYLHLAYLPSPSQIRLRLSAYDIEGRREEEEIERQFGVLERLIPDYFIGYGDATVASATADLLRARRATLAVAESCTGGALSASFTAMAGASDYYLGGVVSYSNDVKVGILGVSPDTLRLHGAVSEQTACEMAEGIRRLCGADYALSTTGVAGPTGGTPEKPVGTVWIGLATPHGTRACKSVFARLRTQNIERAAAAAANMLRLELLHRQPTE